MMANTRVLIVEDQYLLAADMADALTDAGFEVVGPAGTLDDAFILADSGHIDVAVVDCDLRGKAVTPLVHALSARGVPTVMVTGYSESAPDVSAAKPTRYLQKPVGSDAVVRALDSLLH
jgi:ActR/RegA family two-component response regulator